jgi:hypothetical protein
VKYYPQKHWCDNIGWSIVKATITKGIKTTNYILVSCDEVKGVDNQSKISMHMHVIKDWSKMLIMVSLAKVIERVDYGNVTIIII